MNSLSDVRHSWNRFAESDAMTAVMTGEDWDEAAFYQTGLDDIDSLMKEVERVYPEFKRGSAFDFGCGLGRLSLGLARHFDSVTGVDISTRMIERAAANPRTPSNAHFTLNEGERLEEFDTDAFDFVLSLIVLQHIPRKFIKGYLEEFLRIAEPGGLVVFQLPTRKRKRRKPKLELWKDKPLRWDDPPFPKLCYRAAFRLFRWIPRRIVHAIHVSETWNALFYAWQSRKGNAVMQMNTIRIPRLKRMIDDAGGEILEVAEDSRAGDEYDSHTFYVTKRRNPAGPI